MGVEKNHKAKSVYYILHFAYKKRKKQRRRKPSGGFLGGALESDCTLNVFQKLTCHLVDIFCENKSIFQFFVLSKNDEEDLIKTYSGKVCEPKPHFQ